MGVCHSPSTCILVDMRFFLLLTALVGLASSSPLADKNAEERFGFGLIEGAIGAVANALATTTTTTSAPTTTSPTTTTSTTETSTTTPPTTTKTTTTTTTIRTMTTTTIMQQGHHIN